MTRRIGLDTGNGTGLGRVDRVETIDSIRVSMPI